MFPRFDFALKGRGFSRAATAKKLE